MFHFGTLAAVILYFSEGYFKTSLRLMLMGYTETLPFISIIKEQTDFDMQNARKNGEEMVPCFLLL